MELHNRSTNYRNHILAVLCGVFLGAVFTLLVADDGCIDNELALVSTSALGESNSDAVDEFKSKTIDRLKENEAELKRIKEMLLKVKNNTKNIYHRQEEDGRIIDTSLADQLREQVRVLCVVFTVPGYHYEKAIHVKNVWSSRCNDFLVMSTKHDSGLGTIGLNISESEDQLWGKTKEAFKYIDKYHLSNIDWVLKVEDDTYVVMENLRYMLYPYSPEQLIYFGYKRQSVDVKQGYMDKGAYVLSKAAVKKMVHEGIDDATKCRPGNDGDEEIELAKCLEKLDVYAGDSRDSDGKGRFFINSPEMHLLPEKPTDPQRYYADEDGPDCMSEYAISFTNVWVDHLYAFEYLLYHLRPYGIIHYNRPLPAKVNFDDVVQRLKSEEPMIITTTTSTSTTSMPTTTPTMTSTTTVRTTSGQTSSTIAGTRESTTTMSNNATSTASN